MTGVSSPKATDLLVPVSWLGLFTERDGELLECLKLFNGGKIFLFEVVEGSSLELCPVLFWSPSVFIFLTKINCFLSLASIAIFNASRKKYE